MKIIYPSLLFLFIIFCFTSNTTFAQKKNELSAQQLSDKLSNPVSDLISVPFQNNTIWGIGDNNGSQNILNFQPVIPLKLTKSLTLINSLVLPIIAQFNVTGIGESRNSLGDPAVQYFLCT